MNVLIVVAVLPIVAHIESMNGTICALNRKSHLNLTFSCFSMHTNERPYACNLCGKNFSLSSTLKAHFLSHSKEKPHKCLTCNKGFRLPHQLKAHEKTHVHRYEVGVLLYNQDEGDYSSS